MPDISLLTGIFIIAVLYSSVGHAGASGYIAVMTLLGLAPAVIKPTALALNILVAAIASWQFKQAGHFSWRLFWPFALFAVPCAFVGGYVTLPTAGFKVLVGLILLYSAIRLVLDKKIDRQVTQPNKITALLSGGVIGLLSGLTGTGGGIFLTPLLLLKGWAQPKTAAAASALFILLNSIAGLLGNWAKTQGLPDFILPLLAVAGVGGLIGSYLGSKQFNTTLIKQFLAIVLLIAGGKLIFA